MKPFALAFSAVLALGLCLANPSLEKSSRAVATKDAPLKCPVTLLSIPSKKMAAAKSVFKGKTYYFCTTNCKRLFDMNPKKYLAHFK